MLMDNTPDHVGPCALFWREQSSHMAGNSQQLLHKSTSILQALHLALAE